MQEVNYLPLKKAIMNNINRWSLIPDTTIHSGIKINILPRLRLPPYYYFLFHNVPLKKPHQFFMEWDKLLSRYI